MASPASSSRASNGFRSIIHNLEDHLHSLPDDHPLHIVLRTYALSLSLSLGPSLLPFLLSRKARRGGFKAFKNVLQRELGISGFAFAMTVGVGGGAALQHFWNIWEDEDYTGLPLSSTNEPSPLKSRLDRLKSWLAPLQDSHRAFICNIISATISIALFHSRRRRVPSNDIPRIPHIPMTLPRSPGRPSHTLDLTLLLLVRAMDSVTRMILFPPVQNYASAEQKAETQRKQYRLTRKLDALLFWAASARIMWCFFYEPDRLPPSYNKWIMSLANIDPRILGALRAIREKRFSYTKGVSNPPDLLTSFARDLGYPSSWGDAALLPAKGGPKATATWKTLGVSNRDGLGGIPCELVHGGVVGGSCTANAATRGVHAFMEAAAIYLPVHILPILLTRPKKLLTLPTLLTTSFSILRSASFLSTFVSSTWMAVCLTRTVLFARLFPMIPHDFWDGPLGCTFAGSLACGGSIFLEQGKRRGEMALYVLPRAIRACLSENWLKHGKSARLLEKIVFILSLATLLTASIHQPNSLRGLSRWTLAFVMKGPNTGFWKRKRRGTSVPDTPAEPVDPASISRQPDISSL